MKKFLVLGLSVLCAFSTVSLRTANAQPTNVAPPQPTGIGDIVGQAPQTQSFTNATFEIDSGIIGLLGGNTTAQAFLRGSYDWNVHTYTSLELDLGGGNTIKGMILNPLGLRKAFDDYEFYAALGAKYDTDGGPREKWLAAGSIGAKWNVYTALGGSPTSMWARTSLGSEARTQVGFFNQATKPSLDFVGYITYKF